MKVYTVQKFDYMAERVVADYGNTPEEDVKLITRGYKFNGLFYERKNSKFVYFVDEVR